MKRIRIKKEIALVWAVTINGHEEPLEGKDLSLFLVDPKFKKTAKTFHVEDNNKVHFRVMPDEQTFVGVYTLELWANYGKQDQTVVDRRSAFELVNYTPMECDGLVDDIHAAEVYIGAGNLAVGIHGRGIVSVTKVSEDPNDWDYRILYDDGATEIIKIARGEKGLTDEEHAELIAETIAAKSAAQSANLAAALAASKAQEAAEKAQLANDAAEAANAAKEAADAATEAAQAAANAATLAKQAADNAAAAANSAASNANTKAALAQAAADATNAAIAAASTATAAANAATTAANTAAEAANTAAATANSAASNASAKATLANDAAVAANAAKDAANTAASAANAAAALANDAAARAEAAILTIENKIERVELVCEDDQHITRKGSSVALTYAQVKALVDDPKNFVTLRYLDMFWMLPSYDDGGAIMFTSSGIEFGHVVVTRVILNTDGQMNNYSIVAEDSDHKTDDMSKETAMDGHMTYPTTHAVNLKLGDLQSDLDDTDAKVTELGSGVIANGNLKARRITAAATEHTFSGTRVTAGGASIGDGMAYIKRIKGSTLQVGGKLIPSHVEGVKSTGNGEESILKWTDILSQFFPDGMKSLPIGFDSFTSKKTEKIVGWVDLGTLNWGKSQLGSSSYRFEASVPQMKKPYTWEDRFNLVCSKYEANSSPTSYNPAAISGISFYTGSSNVYVFDKDKVGMSVEEFKASMQGVILYFPLAEPIVTEIPETAMWFIAFNGGTEETITTEESAPLVAEIGYRQELSYVTPEMFGAIGDGIADDTEPVQNAFNSGKVVIGRGVYRIGTKNSSYEPLHIDYPIDVKLSLIDNRTFSTIYNNIRNGLIVVNSDNVKLDIDCYSENTLPIDGFDESGKANNLSDVGGYLVRVSTGVQNLTANLRVQHMNGITTGVQSGIINDSNIHVSASLCAYPYSVIVAVNCDIFVDVDGCHRAFWGSLESSRLYVRSKNFVSTGNSGHVLFVANEVDNIIYQFKNSYANISDTGTAYYNAGAAYIHFQNHTESQSDISGTIDIQGDISKTDNTIFWIPAENIGGNLKISSNMHIKADPSVYNRLYSAVNLTFESIVPSRQTVVDIQDLTKYPMLKFKGSFRGETLIIQNLGRYSYVMCEDYVTVVAYNYHPTAAQYLILKNVGLSGIETTPIRTLINGEVSS